MKWRSAVLDDGAGIHNKFTLARMSFSLYHSTAWNLSTTSELVSTGVKSESELVDSPAHLNNGILVDNF